MKLVSQVMTAVQRSLIEGATVSFFTSAISCHPQNQHLFANVLCEVIRAQIPRPNSKCNFYPVEIYFSAV